MRDPQENQKTKGMKQVKRKLLSTLLALLTVFSLSTAAFAEGDRVSTPVMELEWRGEGSKAVVELYLTAPGGTNGRTVITYDPDVLTLQSTAVGSGSWVSSVDSETKGEVAFAWAVSELTEERTLMLTLVLEASVTGVASPVTAKMGELYNDGVEMPLPEAAEVLVTIRLVPSTEPAPTPGKPGTEPTPAPTPGGDDGKRENPFTDIDGHWAEDEIIDAYYAGLVKGIGGGKFAPDMELTRGMFAVLLYRLAGSPAVTGENPFPDVAADMYYADAVVWAYENGIVKGMPGGVFAPDGTLTREQMVTMLHRYAEFAGISTEKSTGLDSFSDADSVSAYAVESMQWAVASDVIKGISGALVPAGTTTRAQAAAVLVRFAG